MRVNAGILGCLLAVGVASAAPRRAPPIATLAPLAAPAFAPGNRTFVAFAGQPARIHVAWTPVSGATRYRARWRQASTQVEVELLGTATSFERAEATAGHHDFTLIAIDAQGRESAPAALGIDVVTIAAIAPGARQSEVPGDRVFGIGTRFSSSGLRCALGGDAQVDAVQATHPGARMLTCGGEAGQPRAMVPVVIAPVVVATEARPVEIGTATMIHVTVASVVDLGEELLIEPIGDVVVGSVERTPTGFEVEVTAGAAPSGLRVVGGGFELGRVDLESVAAPPAPAAIAPSGSDWLALELGGHVGFFVPPTTTIGQPTDAADAVTWGPLFGARFGVFPTRRVGVEAEVGLATTGYAAQQGVAAVLVSRAHVAARVVEDRDYGLRVLAGVDLLAQLVERGTSRRVATAGVHYGAAFTIETRRDMWLRVEALHVILPGPDAGYAHCFELQFGVMTRFGRRDRWW